MRIDELFLMQYFALLPKAWHSPLSDYFMRMVGNGKGKAFLLQKESVFAGYAVLLSENEGWVLKYLYIAPELRRQGCAEYFVRQLVEQMPNYLRVHLVESLPCFDALYACLQKLGFRSNDLSCVYTVPVDVVLWERMEELKMPRMKELFLRNGSECMSFAQMSEEIRQQLLHSTTGEFGNFLEPADLMQNPASYLDEDLSMVLVCDGKLLAYTLITRPAAGTVSVEQIAETHDEIGSGKIIAPLCETLEVVRRIPQITQMQLAISDSNTRSYRFVMEVLKGTEIRKTRNVSLFCSPATLKPEKSEHKT